MSDRRSDPPEGRSAVERAVVAASVLVIGLLVGVLVWAELTGSDAPPGFRTEVGVVREADGAHFVPVQVSNIGGRTAADVVVYAEIGTGPTSTRAEQTVDFLFAGDEQLITFVFAEDPRGEDLVVGVQAFIEP